MEVLVCRYLILHLLAWTFFPAAQPVMGRNLQQSLGSSVPPTNAAPISPSPPPALSSPPQSAATPLPPDQPAGSTAASNSAPQSLQARPFTPPPVVATLSLEFPPPPASIRKSAADAGQSTPPSVFQQKPPLLPNILFGPWTPGSYTPSTVERDKTILLPILDPLPWWIFPIDFTLLFKIPIDIGPARLFFNKGKIISASPGQENIQNVQGGRKLLQYIVGQKAPAVHCWH
eukprot:jgi/Botrbrau1/5793/Bobra.0155s0016.1